MSGVVQRTATREKRPIFSGVTAAASSMSAAGLQLGPNSGASSVLGGLRRAKGQVDGFVGHRVWTRTAGGLSQAAGWATNFLRHPEWTGPVQAATAKALLDPKLAVVGSAGVAAAILGGIFGVVSNVPAVRRGTKTKGDVARESALGAARSALAALIGTAAGVYLPGTNPIVKALRIAGAGGLAFYLGRARPRMRSSQKFNGTPGQVEHAISHALKAMRARHIRWSPNGRRVRATIPKGANRRHATSLSLRISDDYVSVESFNRHAATRFDREANARNVSTIFEHIDGFLQKHPSPKT
ncbi:MAG: hypothetical protein H6729_01500 [Deltaproteobacteria bacterium]|nr:hypothetical protein [Deltaproteobacteria bacterium]